MANEQERLNGHGDRWTVLAMCLSVVGYLALFAWRFADERLYADSSYYLARVINEGTFRIEHGRWVLALAEVWPLIGAKLSWSLHALILLHSFSNVIWMAVFILIAWFALRQPRAALAIALLHLIGIADGLFCPVFELYYAADLLVLYTALLLSERTAGTYRTVALVALQMVITSSHLFAAALLVGTLLLHRIWKEKRLAKLLGTVLLIQLALHAFTLSDYEKDHLAFVKRIDVAELGSWLSAGTWRAALSYGFTHYTDVIIIATLVTAALFLARERWFAMLGFAFIPAALALIALKAPGFMHDRYREQLNFPVVAWIILLAAFIVPWRGRMRMMLYVSVAFAIGYRCFEAERLAPHYQERTAWIRTRVTDALRAEHNKVIVPTPVYFGPEHHAIEAGWSLPVESLLLSAERGRDSTVSIIGTQDLNCPGVEFAGDRLVFRCWDIVPMTWLNARWFKPPTGRYVPLHVEPRP